MRSESNYVIQTSGLCKEFEKVVALNSVDLNVPRNSIFGFLGPNGAGKTTLMKLLLGLSKPTHGKGSIFGHDIVTESVAIRERIGYLPQHPRFIEYMTAAENLEFTARFFFSGPDKKIQERCDEMLELVGLQSKANRPIKNFSGGEKQRLGIALAQINYPDLLILDEPASALDPLGRQDVLDVMARLREHTTIFYSTHILDDVQRVSDTVAILNQGHIVASGPIENILKGKDGTVYTISVKGSQKTVQENLSQLPWVTFFSKTHQNGSCTWQVGVSDETAAEKSLLRHLLSDPGTLVTEFCRKEYELEEIFMEIVKGDEYDR